ncbi:MAG TPA: thioesterase II family protein [Pyrinomonadaceae bacterium]
MPIMTPLMPKRTALETEGPDHETRKASMSQPAITPWLACSDRNPQANLRLFCFPYAGGGAHLFRSWPDQLPVTIEVCPVQLPGRERRLNEPCFTRLPSLVEAAARALLPHLKKPFALFGHSMGTLISFELARLLRRELGIEPVHLFVSGCAAPQIPGRAEPLTYNLPEPEFLRELQRLNGTPKAVLDHPEMMQLMMPILRADFEVTQTYAYATDAPLGCPITAFGGLHDQDVTRADLEAWREQTTASFSLRMFPGDHFFLHPAQSLLLRTLAQQLQPFVTKET